MTPEGCVLKAITDLLTAERILWFRMNSGAMKGIHKGKAWFVKFGTPGMADVIAFPQYARANGTVYIDCGLVTPLWIEVKGPKGSQTLEQRAFEELVKSQNHFYLIARSSDEVLEFLKGKL